MNLIAILIAIPLLLEAHVQLAGREHRLPLREIPAALIALSAIGFCILLSEGAMADWTAVYYRQVLLTGPGIAAEGYAVFSAAMAIFRFFGDWITARLGPFHTVRAGCIVAAVGLLWTLSVRNPAWGLPGLAITGAGLSVIIPLVFGGGGRVPGVNPGPGIATVTGIGYVGFIVGPPTIGFVSQAITLRYALGIVVACCLIAAYLSRFMATLAPASHRIACHLQVSNSMSFSRVHRAVVSDRAFPVRWRYVSVSRLKQLLILQRSPLHQHEAQRRQPRSSTTRDKSPRTSCSAMLQEVRS